MPGLDHLRAAGERVSQSVRTRADLHTAVACGPGVRSSAAKIARRAVSTRFIWLCAQTIVLLVSAASRAAAAGGKAGGARRAAGGTQGAAACQRRLSARSPRRRSPALPPASSGTVALPARGSASGCTAPALPACWRRRGGRHPATATATAPGRHPAHRQCAAGRGESARSSNRSKQQACGCRCAAAGVELWTSTRARPASTRRVQSLPLALWQARRGGHVQRRDFQLPSADGRGC